MVSGKYIHSLDSLTEAPANRFGTKGYNIFLLRKHGFDLPKTYFVEVKAYEDFIERNGILEKIKALEALKDDEEIVKVLKEIKKSILEGVVQEELLKDIEEIICSSEINRFAIRSSATSEDLPYVSFAGMYDTYLNIPCEKVLEYIKMVWASLWNDRAYFYRRKMGIKDVKMAVIIQEFLPSEKSGVAFSADTVTYDPGVIIITATYGLGEGVVSGQVSVDTYYVDKFSGEIIREDVQEKKFGYFPKKDIGTEKREISGDLSKKRVLEVNEIKELSSKIFEFEKSYRKPIDVEWLIYKDKIYIIQVRPITTYEDIYGYYEIEWHKYDNLETIWTNVNIGELMPGIIKPLTWSIMKKNIDYGFREPFAYLPFLRKPINFTRLFVGRAYLNYDALRAIPSILPGGSPEIMDELYLGGIPFEKEPEPKARGFKALEYALRMLRDMSRKKKEADRLIEKLDKAYKEFVNMDLSKISFNELIRLFRNFDEIYEEKYSFAIHIGCSGYALPNINLLKQRIEDLGVDLEKNPLDKKLLIGLSDIESELASAKLWELSQIVKNNSTLYELFRFRNSREILEELYKNRKIYKDFVDNFEKFLVEYGHRCVGEFKLENPRWAEEKEYVIEMVKYYLQTEATSPYQKIEEQKRIREEAEKELIKIIDERIKNPIKRKYFKTLIKTILKNAQQFVRYRENMKTALVKLSFMRRKLALEIGKRLSLKGLIDDPNDIFYLREEELYKLIDGDISGEIAKTIINRRKRIYEDLEKVQPPDIIVGYLKPEQVIKKVEIEEGENILRGIPGSPGVYRGIAKVIMSPKEFDKLKKGDILVAPATDLGWTPLYLISGALVVEIGSILSHGAIIAREYGIPAVMNVKNATKIIKDGDLIEVDGTNGVVKILKRGERLGEKS